MTELVKVRLRTLGWAILPVLVLAVIPWWLNRHFQGPSSGPWGLWQWIGLWLIVNGLGLGAWCVNLFNVEGLGTPLPLDPPKRFVVRGPYRWMRNPMMVGAFLILGGEAMLFESRVLAVYALAIMIFAHLIVRFWEESDLARRFGEPYRTYQRQVPRWIPRVPLKLMVMVGLMAFICGLGGCEKANFDPVLHAPGSFKLSIAPFPAKDMSSWERYVDAYRQARSLGVTVAHSYMHWGDVERAADELDWQSPEYYAILSRQHGMELSMEITVINVHGMGKLPRDLEGRNVSDPQLKRRFVEFVGLFCARWRNDVQYLWLGNEVDLYLHKNPSQIDAWTELYRQAVSAAHAAAPETKVGTVMTFHEALKNGRLSWVDRWGPLGDAVAVTYYPQMMPGGYNPRELKQQFDQMIEAYGSYPLALVETGVGSAREYGGGEAAQVEFCNELFRALRRHREKLLFAGWFNLHDFSPAIVEAMFKGWGVESQEFKSWVGSTGLASFRGNLKPVYAQWKQEASSFLREAK